MGITVSTQDAVRRITIDRTKKRNALDLDTLSGLLAALEGARQESIRVVVLAAEGPVFSAGGDLEVMKRFVGDGQAAQARLREGLNRVVLALHDLPKPVIAEVQGNAYGAGALLAFQTDLPVLASEAEFAMSFRHVGLIPDTGGTWLLPRRLGLPRAKHLVWTGAPFSAADAVLWGLALRHVPATNLRATVDALAAALVDAPAATLGLAKQALEANGDLPLREALSREARLQGQAFTTKEHAIGRDAFFARTRPAWRKG